MSDLYKFQIRFNNKNIILYINIYMKIKDFIYKIHNEFNILYTDKIYIKTGFPPKYIKNDNLLVKDEFNNGDLIHIFKENEKNEKNEKNEEMILERMVVPSDNSCLFTCISILDESKSSSDVRRVAASEIIANPLYDEAILGRSPSEYCEWITKPDSWGGYVELVVLSTYFKIQILVLDILTCRQDIYGEEFTSRIILLYDGIHYDYIIGKKNEKKVNIFSVNDDLSLKKAMAIVRDLNQKKQAVSLSDFTIQCKICDLNFVGQAEAAEHCKKTGHMNFAEI
eukprot:GHVL01041182.1.p1 GENE.GHVL01041182.1~~GHVL01041182.1.p1  ORF type:complete len:282 (+),score=72.18 GHVL01041182.1:25-870(+)